MGRRPEKDRRLPRKKLLCQMSRRCCSMHSARSRRALTRYAPRAYESKRPTTYEHTQKCTNTHTNAHAHRHAQTWIQQLQRQRCARTHTFSSPECIYAQEHKAAAGRSAVVSEMFSVSTSIIRDLWARKIMTSVTEPFWTDRERLLYACEQFRTVMYRALFILCRSVHFMYKVSVVVSPRKRNQM